MSTRPNDGPFVVANLALLIGLWFIHASYASGDPSGVQYMFLFIGGGVAGIGLLLWTGARLARCVAPLWFGLICTLAIAVAALPQLTGLGYNGDLLDQLGRYTAVAIGIIQLVLLVTTLWRSYRPVA